MFVKKVKKYYEYIMTKFNVLLEQKSFRHDTVVRKYIYKDYPKSDVLVVVFSSCTRPGLKARYNYVRTLNPMPVKRLFILDDTGSDNRGSYYMGYNWNFKEEAATIELIKSFIEKTKAKKVIFCGSSKGGYSALNLGMAFENSRMIVGSPQYYLATYLETSSNIPTLTQIMGEKTPEKFEKLDFYLRDKLKNNQYIKSQKIYYHYSNKEHTYFEHVKDMIRDMKKFGYDIKEDVADYTNHSEISYYFPDFLKKSIYDIIRNQD
ncbi:hypothetical protein SAMN05216249_11249 [Acetitomaculum ruminis DSM 5522]|uniref:Two component regulator three Y domain-containing protein n=1 Tax=Acetitomaculum ruminis DSM 5522 TaxID=1120918 RepID=A0A1I0Z0Z0_9FIRM|nr:hypothetical protein [Acetitomaculum ruminis]SFB19062.1 hypothetical protein SAMN05216249_11249 [Acetitomaculum ruminis DSM 5522]